MLKRIFYPKNEGIFFLCILGSQFLVFFVMIWLQNNLYPAPARGFTTQITSHIPGIISMIDASEIRNYRAQIMLQEGAKAFFLVILAVYILSVVIRIKNEGIKPFKLFIYLFSLLLIVLFSSIYTFFLAPFVAWN